MADKAYDVVIVGAGSIGISVAYFLSKLNPRLRLLLVDNESPMSFTSAVSGENYRNWWPHQIMKDFMERSIALMEQIDGLANQSVVTTRTGYLLATRDENPSELLNNLSDTSSDKQQVRCHQSSADYSRALLAYEHGTDVLQSQSAIHQIYSSFDEVIKTIVHIRNGGSISAQQLGAYMLSQYKANNGVFLQAQLTDIDYHDVFTIQLDNNEAPIQSTFFVNAAGPMANGISRMLGIELPLVNVLQQKIAFADHLGVIDRNLPFTIDLDEQYIDWTDDERDNILHDDTLAFLGKLMPGSIHRRPDGGPGGNRVKLGWAYNSQHTKVERDIPLDPHFPEVVLRGACRLQPGLRNYYNGFPREFIHYGGYYTMTEENWPLIGETAIPGYVVSVGMSGFGSMAACAAGELAALTITGDPLPDYARALSLQRYQDPVLMAEIESLNNRGIL